MSEFWGRFVPADAPPASEVDLLMALNDVFRRSARTSPEVILCGAPFAAGMRATVEFTGRDRRRIKREVNKAMRKARRP